MKKYLSNLLSVPIFLFLINPIPSLNSFIHKKYNPFGKFRFNIEIENGINCSVDYIKSKDEYKIIIYKVKCLYKKQLIYGLFDSNVDGKTDIFCDYNKCYKRGEDLNNETIFEKNDTLLNSGGLIYESIIDGIINKSLISY